MRERRPFFFAAAGTAYRSLRYGADRTGACRSIDCTKDVTMLALIAGILLILWLLGFLAFHVAGGLIHILLVVAVIVLVLHFVRGRA